MTTVNSGLVDEGTERASQNTNGNGDANDLSLGDASLLGTGSSVVTSQVPAEGTAVVSQDQMATVAQVDQVDRVDTMGLEPSDVHLLARLQSEMFVGDNNTFDEVADSIRTDMAVAERLTREVGAAVVRRYCASGLKLNAVAAVKTEKAFSKWVKESVARNDRELEFVRQARLIASMGEGILAYANLGKNRLRELNYMLKELPEYQENKLTPEIIREALRKLERQYPFTITAEMSDEDIKAFRAWMDGIITKWRLDQALNGSWEAPFNLCEQIGRARGLALEKNQAETVAQWLLTKADKLTALTIWIDKGIPSDERGKIPADPKRLMETLTRITNWATDIAQNAASINAILKSTDAKLILAKAVSAIRALDSKLPAAGEVK
jgi:hypothetical protein